MKTRLYRAEDEPALRRLYEQMGFDYAFPDLNAAQFVSIWVVVDDDDLPVMALAARKTVEMFMLADKEWMTPGLRMEAFSAVSYACHVDVKSQGFEDANCWLPPKVEKSFGRRLVTKFGWIKSRWTDYSKQL
jgi:hypothetical protein